VNRPVGGPGATRDLRSKRSGATRPSLCAPPWTPSSRARVLHAMRGAAGDDGAHGRRGVSGRARGRVARGRRGRGRARAAQARRAVARGGAPVGDLAAGAPSPSDRPSAPSPVDPAAPDRPSLDPEVLAYFYSDARNAHREVWRRAGELRAQRLARRARRSVSARARAEGRRVDGGPRGHRARRARAGGRVADPCARARATRPRRRSKWSPARARNLAVAGWSPPWRRPARSSRS